MKIYGEKDISIAMRNSIETVGFPVINDDRKTYFFGQLPMAEAFIAWSHSNDTDKIRSDTTNLSWCVNFQFYSVALGILLALGLWWVWGK